MRVIGSLLWAVGLVVFFNSCFDAPHYSPVPEIDYNSLVFRKGPIVDGVKKADTLILTINFKDGDGDLGINSLDDEKFVNRWFFEFPDGTFISYETKLTVPGYDTLPPLTFPYTCTNWQLAYDSINTNQLDTANTYYFQLNPNYYNIFVDIYVAQDDGTFKKFDWLNEFPTSCLVGGLNGRFPVLSKDLSRPTVQEGSIRYAMPSAGWLVTFSIKTLYIDVHIQDRAFHKSNIVSTPKFTLQSILK